MAINYKKTVARGLVALSFGAALSVGAVGTANASCADGNYSSAADQQACEQWSNDQAQDAQTSGTSPNAQYQQDQVDSAQQQSSGGYIPPAEPGTQAYYDACVGPSDVNPNWQPQSWCSSQQQSQSVPTTVAAGGQAPANYDATNNRSADTLVLP